MKHCQVVVGKRARTIEVGIDDVGLVGELSGSEALTGHGEGFHQGQRVMMKKGNIFIIVESNLRCEEGVTKKLICPEMKNPLRLDQVCRRCQAVVQIPKIMVSPRQCDAMRKSGLHIVNPVIPAWEKVRQLIVAEGS